MEFYFWVVFVCWGGYFFIRFINIDRKVLVQVWGFIGEQYRNIFCWGV